MERGQKLHTPCDDSPLSDKMRSASVKDLDEHSIHVVSFDTVPEKRNKD